MTKGKKIAAILCLLTLILEGFGGTGSIRSLWIR